MKTKKTTKAKSPVNNPPAAAASESDFERAQVAVFAHQIWELEGRPEGRAMDHWLEAESQFRQIHASRAAA